MLKLTYEDDAFVLTDLLAGGHCALEEAALPEELKRWVIENGEACLRGQVPADTCAGQPHRGEVAAD